MSPSFLDDAAAPDALPAQIANLPREQLLAWCSRAGVTARLRVRQTDNRVTIDVVELDPELTSNDISTQDVRRAVSLHLRSIARDAGYRAVREYLAELDGAQISTDDVDVAEEGVNHG
ncbi:hypothetical protein [Hyphomicrobium sp. D-2]|uniref:hypothetical protein n=1 Tax=Hyphomicrobium sp. D-2 TaxID=3041621 RepID=UPI002455D16F|nr:hypothetical protein [Hyphomicrobium sp. D-2]MDH4983260.1 hypothetical protein [Hyphomicrobium sp. D-2]